MPARRNQPRAFRFPRAGQVATRVTGQKRARSRSRSMSVEVSRVRSGLTRLNRMIETKEGQWASPANVQLAHNAVYVVQNSTGGDLNPIRCTQGTGDPMSALSGNRIGDKITLRGVTVRGQIETALNRAKVYFKIMVIKCPRGVSPTLANNLFKQCSNNKMIDMLNTEKFTILWSKQYTVTTSNNAPTGVSGTGVPSGGTPSGIGTRIFKAWIPGSKFAKNGTIVYEDGSSTNAKFFDYRVVIVTYDWYGTPQDVNNVGVLNEMYTKMYFKDA